MSSASETAAFDRATEPVLRILNRDQAATIANFHADEALQSRIEELSDKATEDELTSDEQAELEGYAQANRFVAILQARARKLLAS
ncbi:MAG TPA: hypothetical protein DCY13_17080 [Verrucomicrobiales bacterium]|nr:hypothetical protein [Verrucomicrobiales bacterium]